MSHPAKHILEHLQQLSSQLMPYLQAIQIYFWIQSLGNSKHSQWYSLSTPLEMHLNNVVLSPWLLIHMDECMICGGEITINHIIFHCPISHELRFTFDHIHNFTIPPSRRIHNYCFWKEKGNSKTSPVSCLGCMVVSSKGTQQSHHHSSTFINQKSSHMSFLYVWSHTLDLCHHT